MLKQGEANEVLVLSTHTHTHSQLSPENGESYVEYLISIGRLDEAAVKLAEIVNDVSQCMVYCVYGNFLYLQNI